MAETKNGIKYPDNYDSVADIPADLKKMAESIDAQIEKKVEKENGKGLSTNDFTNADKEKLDGLKNYNDTKIKKDMSDIQKEQETQNTDISTLKTEKEALEKEVQNLREDNRLNSLTEDNEGELINITNSTGSRFNSLEIEGNEKQDTREGYNLFDYLSVLKEEDKGLTITKDDKGYVFVNGTPNADYPFLTDYTDITDKLKNGKTYTLWQEKYRDNNSYGFYIQIDEREPNGSHNYYNSRDNKAVFVANLNNTYKICIQSGIVSNLGILSNYKNRYMLYEGIDDKEFELYGAMPSFDYPSEVKCVGDNINLFSTDFYDDFSNNLGATHEIIDNMIKASTSSVNQFSGIFLNIARPNIVELDNKIKGKTVTYSFEAKADDNINLSFGKNGNVKIRQVSKKWRKYFITYPNTSNSSIYFYNNSATVTNFYVKNIKLEYGERASTYSPHGLGSIGFKIVDKNILNIEKDSSVEANGLSVTTDSDGVLTLNGTTTNNIYLSLDLKYIGTSGSSIEQKKFKKGTYVFSSENLSSLQDINVSAYVRETAAGGQVVEYALLYRPFYAKNKNAKFILDEEVDAVPYLWIANNITFNNAKIKFQLELAESASDFVAHEEQTYVVPVQQKMLSGDKFVKINGSWKEQHTWLELVFDGVNRQFNHEGTGTSGKNRLLYHITEKVKNCNTTNKIIAYCSNSKLIAEGATYSCNIGFTVANNIIYMYVDGREASEINAELQDNPITFYIPLQEDSYQYLDCTDEQIAVLDKIEQEAHTYSEVTNVFTEDSVGATIKTNTAVDLKTVINNVVEAQLQEIGG